MGILSVSASLSLFCAEHCGQSRCVSAHTQRVASAACSMAPLLPHRPNSIHFFISSLLSAVDHLASGLRGGEGDMGATKHQDWNGRIQARLIGDVGKMTWMGGSLKKGPGRHRTSRRGLVTWM